MSYRLAVIRQNANRVVVTIGNKHSAARVERQTRRAIESRSSRTTTVVKSPLVSRESLDPRKHSPPYQADRVPVGDKDPSELTDLDIGRHNETRGRQRTIDQIPRVRSRESGDDAIRFEKSKARVPRVGDKQSVAPHRNAE